MTDESDDEPARPRWEGFNNLVAITIAFLASFVAVATIKADNIDQAIQQAQTRSNDSWAWYQAVRVREDMAAYEMSHLQRLARAQPAADEAAKLAGEIKAQEQEI